MQALRHRSNAFVLARAASAVLLVLVASSAAQAGRPRPPAPVISGVSIDVADATTATVTWTTDVPATSVVDYGLTTAYEQGTASASGDPVTSHSVTLSGLVPGTGYYARVRSKSSQNVEAASGPFPFATPAAADPDPSGFRSDDFNTCVLDTARWRLADPLGDVQVAVVGAGSGDARLEIEVPAGDSHNPWVSNTAARLLQAVEDVDFTLVARFESPLEPGQILGLVAEESSGRFLRLDAFHDGVSTRIFAGAVWDGAGQVITNQPIPGTLPLYLQIQRVGDQWTLSYGFDGSGWTAVASFPRVMALREAGVVAGNFGPAGAAPAHTALVDYVFSAATPILDEDLAPVPTQAVLDVVSGGPGAVELAPAGGSYACGTEVTLTALPDPEAELVGWGGALSGRSSPATLLLLGDATVSAAFGPDVTPPQILSLDVAAGPAGAVVRWTTDEATTGVVEYGETTAYGNAVASPAPALSHEVTLTGLLPQTAHFARIEAVDGALNATLSSDVPFTTTGANGSAASGLRSDDFNTCVLDGNVWSAVDPLADATFAIVGAGSGDSKLHIGVPGGVEHEPGNVNRTARILQPANDADLAIEVRFTSDVTERYQEQGIFVEGAAGDYLRFDFYGDGASRFLFAAGYTPTSSTSYGNTAIPSGGDGLYMRIVRAGDQWTQSWSLDGETWTQAVSFSHVSTVTGAGVFAGNEGSGGVIPAHTAIVDWFSVVETPAVPEDLTGTIETATLTVSVDGPGSVERDPDQGGFGCGESVAVTAVPDPGYAFDGWSGDLSGFENPETLVMTSDRAITARFIVDVVPPVISDVEVFRTPSGAIVVWETDEPATSRVRYGPTTAYGSETFDPALVKSHLVTIDGLDPLQDYQFQVESTDGAGLTTASPNVSGPAPTGPTITIFQGAVQEAGLEGRPQPMWNLLGNAVDDDGVQSVTVSVNGGPALPLSLGSDLFRLDEPGDFNAEIPYSSLAAGPNQLLVRATDTLGNPSVAIVQLDLADLPPPPPDLVIDWSAAPSLQSVATPVDGDWRIEGSTVRAVEMGYDRLLGIGDLSWTEYEAEVTFTFHGYEEVFTSPSNGAAVGIIARWPGHTPDGFQPARQWFPLGAYAAHLWQPSASTVSQSTKMWGSAGIVLGTVTGITLAPGEDYTMKLRVEDVGGGSSLYSFKLWRTSDPEPFAWTMQGIDANDTPSGSLLLVAHHTDVSWRSVRISSLLP